MLTLFVAFRWVNGPTAAASRGRSRRRGRAGCSRHPTDVRPPWAIRSQVETRRGHRRGTARRSRVGPRPSSVRSWSPSHVGPNRPASAGASGVVVGRGTRERAAAAMVALVGRSMIPARCALRCVHVLRFRSLVDRPSGARVGSSRTWRCASPDTGTYARTDNDVKSDGRSWRLVHSHGNSPISGLLRMIAVPRRAFLESKFANRFGAGSVASDSSSGACAPPDRTAATPHLRVRNPSQTGRGRSCTNHDGGS